LDTPQASKPASEQARKRATRKQKKLPAELASNFFDFGERLGFG
jgi:hypothetical protein